MKQRRINLQHLTFSPKYRRPVFQVAAIAERAEHHIRHICDLKNIVVHAISIQADHVHLFIEIPKTMSVSKAAHLVKWYSSRWLRIEFDALKTYPKKTAFWQTNYFSRSVGGDKRHVEKYIADQTGHDHEST